MRLDQPPGYQISVVRLQCSKCGKETNASCDCCAPSHGKASTKKSLSLDVLRVRDLSALARYRYSDGNYDYELPETEDGYLIALAIITHQRFKSAAWLFMFCHDRAPWLDPREIDRTALRPQTADALGRELRLTTEVRERLRIRTIGSCDQSRAERAIITKERKRQRDRERRRQGRQRRADWLAANALSRTRPWEADGVSRRTWERRRKRDAGVSPHKEDAKPLMCDTPAATYARLVHLLRPASYPCDSAARAVVAGNVLADGDHAGGDTPAAERIAA
ncbi:MAG TPA: hypothetical protein VKG24_02955 [Pseudolabrys sp.]|nr:hypothetical protein [Pseudolabrys sp.]